MDKDFLKKAISEHLQAINEQLDVIVGHDKKIPQIELDIIMNYTQKFYDYLVALKKENAPDKPGEIDEIPAVKDAEKKVEEAPAEKAQPEKSKEEKAIKEETESQKPEPAIETKTENNKPKTEEAPPVKEKIAKSAETLADKLTKEDKPRVADKIQRKSVSSLKKAIGINDKFLFINELFRGKLREYNEAIETLDECKSLMGCRSAMEGFATSYKWDKKSDPYRKLDSLVKQKFEA